LVHYPFCMMKRNFLAVALVLAAVLKALAGEGMWLPLLLKQNEAEMQRMGMKMTAEDIYSINKGSLKDAIIRFGGGCTGSVISPSGLILTNHHCGYGQIQYHSSLERNYLENGFWAKSPAEELPNPGLTVTFITRIEDVSKQALAGVTANMTERERQAAIEKNTNEIASRAAKEAWQDAAVRPFYYGNAYYLFITETFRDIRLVGAPPGAVGKFGADTDNWVWPRHTGDFSMFRIYADQNNRPAAYAPGNVPYRPKHYLPVSLNGIKPGDFTLVFGFPGRTTEYLPASAVAQTVNLLNPIRIDIRNRSLAVLDAAMRADAKVKIQYASKQAGLANSWKKWIGENQGLKKADGIALKKKTEAAFQSRVMAKSGWAQGYGSLLPELDKHYAAIAPYAAAREYINEIVGANVELLRFANSLRQFVAIHDNNGLEALSQRKDQIKAAFEAFYKDYRPEVDQQVLAALIPLYFEKVPGEYLSPFAIEQMNFAGKDAAEFARITFLKSELSRPGKWATLAASDPAAAIKSIREDYAYLLARSILETAEARVFRPYNEINDKISIAQRRYMQALLEVFPEKRFYPDANSTLRVTYGKVEGYQPRDGVYYQHYTYLDGVMEKYQPGDYEFDVPERLRTLYQNKDYGPYAENGRMPVCFIGSNHTTGGNSGSPAIDGSGNLIGLNFDRVWEGTMSDILYAPDICRNIMVDIRYILFMVDKYAGASHLIREMKIVQGK
jgi:hypothetical protein